MTIYIILVLTIFVFSHLGTMKYSSYFVSWKEQKLCNVNDFYLLVVSAICILIPTLRSETVGLDTIVYKDAMITSSQLDFFKTLNETRFEPGYVLIQIISAYIGSMVLLQFIVAYTYIVGVCRFIKDYSNIKWLSFLFFIIYGFYYLNFNEMRQAMAMGFACYSFKHIVTPCFKKFVFWVLFASLFHTTALMLLPTYIFSRINTIKIYQVIICLMVLVVVNMISNQLYETLNTLSSIQYKNASDDTGGQGLLLLQLITLTLAFMLRKKLSNNRYNVIAYLMLCYSIILFPICSLNPAMFRLEQYSWIYMIILVPNIIHNLQSHFIRFCAIACYVFVGLFLGLTSYYTEGNQIIPYTFFWEK